MEKVIKVKRISKIQQNSNLETTINPYGIGFTANPKTLIEMEANQFLTEKQIKELKNVENIKIVYTPKVEILDKKEKEYLKNVIKPFRNRVTGIAKYSNGENEYICISYKDDVPTDLADFKKNSMYKNMIKEKEYTLEELGL